MAWPTIEAIAGNKLGSGLVDLYLAHNGVESQLTDRPPAQTNYLGNLFDPTPGDCGAHGSFDDRSRSLSPVMWLNEHRGPTVLAVGGMVVLAWIMGR